MERLTLCEGNEIKHAYYQWVIFALFFQALLSYFPHYLWKNLEGGKISLLLEDLPQFTLQPEGEKINRKRYAIDIDNEPSTKSTLSLL